MTAGASALLDPDRVTAEQALDTIVRLRGAYGRHAATVLEVRPPLPERRRRWWGDSCLLLVVAPAPRGSGS